LVSLGDDDAFLIVNAQLNAGESFATESLFHVPDGRLRRIPTESSEATSGDGCKNVFRDELHWRSEAAASGGPPTVIAEIDTIASPRDDTTACDRGHKPAEKSTQVRHRYRWDAVHGPLCAGGGNTWRLAGRWCGSIGAAGSTRRRGNAKRAIPLL